MTLMTGLKEDVLVRPVSLDDVAAAVNLFNAVSQETLGLSIDTVEKLRAEWETPGWDVQENARGIFDQTGRMIAYAETWHNAPHTRVWLWGRVHPDYRGQGYGTEQLAWAESRVRNAIIPLAPPDAQVIGQVTNQGDDAEAVEALVMPLGFDLTRHFYRMRIDMDAPPPAPQWPEGITVRPIRWPDEFRAGYAALDEAFRDHWGHVDAPFEEALERFRHRLNSDPDFDPALWYVAVDGDEVAGISLCYPTHDDMPGAGWVGSLGVRRPWRRCGLGMALLQHSFGEFYRRGTTTVGLGVDASNPTGATRLYERAGMHVDRRSAVYSKELRPGVSYDTAEA